MSVKIKYIAVLALAALLAVPAYGVSADGQENAAGTADVQEDAQASDEDTGESEETSFREPSAVLSSMLTASENSSFRFCYSEEEDLFALVNKKNGYVWWSSPVNAQCDPDAKGQIRNEIASSLVITGGEPDKRTTFTMRSAKNAKMICKVTDGVLRVTYRFPSAGFVIPVDYYLDDDCIRAHVSVSDIEEKNKDGEDPKILLSVSVFPNITAADSSEEGYYIIPDGCGAKISFNNGKTNAREYHAKIYGDDIAAAPVTKPAVTQQISVPVYGTIKSSGNGMAAVLTKGDSNADIHASVSGLSKSSYNLCSSSFCLRSTDTYYMDKEPLTVFQKGDILTPELEIRFYPLYKEDLGFEDAAAVYRNYLINEENISQTENRMPLYINLYGAALKKEPVLGIPVTGRKAFTTFEQAQQIVSELVSRDAGNMVVTYDNWTDDGIKNKVDLGTAPSSALGSDKNFISMTEYFRNNDVSFYPVSDNRTFESGNGYWTFTDTAIRASGQYSRQLTYNLAYGTQDSTADPVSLLSPSAFSEIYTGISSGYSEKGISGFCPGSMTSVLYSDFGKDPLCRNDMMNIISAELEKCRSEIGSVLERSANAYAFRAADHITDVPLCSGKYDIFDEDIPFLQVILHGLIPYSSCPVNGSADSERLFLNAVAAGSSISYDMVYEQASELKDTEYDDLYYAHYSYWADTAVSEHKLLRDILAGTENDYIVKFRRSGDMTVTEYSSGKKIKVDFSNGEIEADGKIYRLSDHTGTEGGRMY